MLLAYAMVLTMDAQMPGSLDSSFGVNGTVLHPMAARLYYPGIASSAVQKDGKILALVGGYADFMAGRPDAYTIYRYEQDGSYDPGFNGTGSHTVPLSNPKLVLQADGKMILAGQEGEEIMLMRFLPNGRIDSNYGNFGMIHTGLFTPLSSALLQTDGKILICGNAYSGSKLFVLRLNADGSRDFAFGDKGLAFVSMNAAYQQAISMALQDDGKILLAGYINKNNLYYTALARLDTKGQPDSSFNHNGQQTISLPGFFVNSVLVQGDQKILLGGTYYFNNYANTGLGLARLKSDGSPDSSFGSKGVKTTNFGTSNDVFIDMLWQWDGRILVSGRSTTKFAMARFMPNGSFDVSFNANGKQTTSFGATYSSSASKIILRGNKILLFGLTIIDDTTHAFSMARYHLGFNSGIAGLSKDRQLKLYPNPSTDACNLVYALPQEETVHISLLDMAGRTVRTFIHAEARNEGQQQESIQLGEDIPPGCYILQVSTARETMQIRLMKQ